MQVERDVNDLVINSGVITSVTMQGDGSNYSVGDRITIQLLQNNVYIRYFNVYFCSR